MADGNVGRDAAGVGGGSGVTKSLSSSASRLGWIDLICQDWDGSKLPVFALPIYGSVLAATTFKTALRNA